MFKVTQHPVEILQVGAPNDQVSNLAEALTENFSSSSNLRRLKKQVRKENVGIILLSINSDEEEELALQILDYVRNGLRDQDKILLVLHSPNRELDALKWIQEFSVDGFINLAPEKELFNRKLIARNIQQWERSVKINYQHKAEKELLMCVTRFSRYSEDLPNLITTFTESLADLCFASAYCRITINNDGTGKIKNAIPNDENFVCSLNDAFRLPELPSYLKRALIEKKPQIDLLPADSQLKSTEAHLEGSLGSYLIFPLIVYDRVYELMIFLIPEEYMDSVSMHQVDVITRASEQLTILLERRESELRLKKQYKRLKDTLVELKQTQDQLAYSEKMSTVGQLAAGIAHEINNPLAFVLSNFGSIDEYLTNIIDMQAMHEQFLNAIDNDYSPKLEQLKSEISDYQDRSNIDFIYSDLREIVNESREGLNRVREIVADLQVFAHGGETGRTIVNLASAVNQTLKLLLPIIQDKIEIRATINPDTSFSCHNGYLQQILTNIIKNAADALIEAETSNPKIEISSHSNNEEIFIRIRDNGPGILKENQSKIFDPFFTTKKVGEGTGLGMSVTFNLVKKLKGKISVSSEVGVYCEFTVALPI